MRDVPLRCGIIEGLGMAHKTLQLMHANMAKLEVPLEQLKLGTLKVRILRIRNRAAELLIDSVKNLRAVNRRVEGGLERRGLMAMGSCIDLGKTISQIFFDNQGGGWITVGGSSYHQRKGVK